MSLSFAESLQNFINNATDQQIAALINTMTSFLLREMPDKFDNDELKFLYQLDTVTFRFLNPRQEGE